MNFTGTLYKSDDIDHFIILLISKTIFLKIDQCHFWAT